MNNKISEIPLSWIEKDATLIRVFPFGKISSCIVFVQQVNEMLQSTSLKYEISIENKKDVKISLISGEALKSKRSLCYQTADQISEWYDNYFRGR